MDQENQAKKQRGKRWEKMDIIRDYVVRIKKKYPHYARHIEPDMIFYSSFSQEKSKVQAKIIPIKDVWSLFSPQCYILAVHKESWDLMDEAQRYYVIFHELLHIPEFGFIQGESDFKKLDDHDVQDFAILLEKFGVYRENIKDLVEDRDITEKEEVAEE